MAYVYLGVFALIIASILTSLFGLYLAFSASVLLGFVVLLVEPAPLVIGLWYIFFGVNLAEKLLIAFT